MITSVSVWYVIIMIKKILKLSFIAAVAVAAGYTAYIQSQKAEALSDLTMDNVEALASGENPFCPNGCKLNGPGCLCDGWWPNEREAI